MVNFLTVDVEEWYHVTYEGIDTEAPAAVPTNLDQLVRRLIDLLDRHGARSTFFVLGSVAAGRPAIPKAIAAAGHEVASHGMAHRSLKTMTGQEFASDLRQSCDILEQAVGEKVRGFRAPSFSVTRDAVEWFYPVLEEQGLSYSSSVFPGQTFHYGIPGFQAGPHHPVAAGRRSTVLEIPLPRLRLAGFDLGLWLRLLPAWCVRRRVDAENRAGRPAVLYVHPREIDPGQPRLPLPPFTSLIHYWGVGGCERKLDYLLRSGIRFGLMRDFAAAMSQGAESHA